MSDKAEPNERIAVVKRWQSAVYNLAYRMLGNEADAADATQEIFIRVLREYHRYGAEREFRPWLFQVARNVIRNSPTAGTGSRARWRR